MSGTLTLHSSHEGFGALFQSVAAALGVTPQQLYVGPPTFPAVPEVNILAPVSLVQTVAPQGSQFVVGLQGGATFRLTLQNNIVSQTSLEAGGQQIFSWQGQLDLNRFLSGNWLTDTVHGSAGADWFTQEYGRNLNGGGGNDFFDIALLTADVPGGSLPAVTVAGGSGVDNFLVTGRQGNLTLTDYQQGEKIIFGDYENLDALLRDVRGLQETANGFVVHFSSENSSWQQAGAWSLTFQNFSLAQLNTQDLLFQVNAMQVSDMLAPILGSHGLNMADLMG